MRGGTATAPENLVPGSISIHPPHAGWDGGNHPGQADRAYFNPPTPCGVGRWMRPTRMPATKFQSTHPMRGGTVALQKLLGLSIFQSTHPIRGGTPLLLAASHPPPDFNPPTPYGVGLCSAKCLPDAAYFNPPTPYGVGPTNLAIFEGLVEFQSTHPIRGGT